jgi:hypothetical protein
MKSLSVSSNSLALLLSDYLLLPRETFDILGSAYSLDDS